MTGPGPGGAADAVPGVGPAQRGVEFALQRLVLVVFPPWWAVLTLAGVAAVGVWVGPVVALASVVALGGYLVFLGAGRRRAIQLLGPLAVSAALLVALNPAPVGPDAYTLVVNWLAMTCFCIGALLRGRMIIWACAGVVGGCLAVALARELVDGSTVTFGLYLAVAVFSLVDGLAVGAAATVARQSAAGVDRAEVDRAQAAATAARAEAAERESQRLTRVMHDTAVNTLGAVHQWPQQDRDALAQRCAADLAILARAQHREIRRPEDLVASVVSRAQLLGVDLQVEVARWGPDLDPEVAAVLEGAGWEALNNVVKHSGQRRARLHWSWDGHDGVLVMSDPGRGFSLGGVRSPGGGLDSVTRRAARVGVSVALNSTVGAMTSVELHWRDDRHEGLVSPGGSVQRQHDTLASVMAEAGWRIAAILGGVGVISTVLLPSGPPRWGSLVALGIVAAVAAYCRSIARGSVLPPVPGVVYAVAALAAAVLPGIGPTGCARVGGWWWGPMAGLAVIYAAVLVDRRTAVVVSAVTAYVVGMLLVIRDIGDPWAVCSQDAWSVLVFNLAIVGALVLFRRLLVKLWEQGQQIHDSRRADAVAQARAEEATRVRREHVDVAHRVAGPILEALASGQADPLDPRTRDAAGRAEGALRALAAIPPSAPPSQAEALAGLVLDAHARGVALHLSLPAGLAVGEPLDPDPGSPVLAQFVAACSAGSTAQLTYLHLGATTQALAWAELRGFEIAALRRAVDRDPPTWSLDSSDGQVLLESVQPPAAESAADPPGCRPRGPVRDSRRDVGRFPHTGSKARGVGHDGSTDRDRR